MFHYRVCIAYVKVWNIETFEREKSIIAHDNPVGTLVTARGMLFGGSLKVIKVCFLFLAVTEVIHSYLCFAVKLWNTPMDSQPIQKV